LLRVNETSIVKAPEMLLSMVAYACNPINVRRLKQEDHDLETRLDYTAHSRLA
jgi:hypothetical protein